MIAWLIGASTFTLLCVVAAIAFVLWCSWSIVWYLYDTRQENSRRIANNIINQHRITPALPRDWK